MKIIIEDVIVHRVYENKFREKFITLKIKKEDITADMTEQFREFCEDGTAGKFEYETADVTPAAPYAFSSDPLSTQENA